MHQSLRRLLHLLVAPKPRQIGEETMHAFSNEIEICHTHSFQYSISTHTHSHYPKQNKNISNTTKDHPMHCYCLLLISLSTLPIIPLFLFKTTMLSIFLTLFFFEEIIYMIFLKLKDDKIFLRCYFLYS